MALKTKPFVDKKVAVTFFAKGKFRRREQEGQEASLRSTVLMGSFNALWMSPRRWHPDQMDTRKEPCMVIDEVLVYRGPVWNGERCQQDAELHLALSIPLSENPSRREIGAITTIAFPLDPELREACERDLEIGGTPLDRKLKEKWAVHASDYTRNVDGARLLCRPEILGLAVLPAVSLEIPVSQLTFLAETSHRDVEIRAGITEALDHLASQSPELAALISRWRIQASGLLERLFSHFPTSGKADSPGSH